MDGNKTPLKNDARYAAYIYCYGQFLVCVAVRDFGKVALQINVCFSMDTGSVQTLVIVGLPPKGCSRWQVEFITKSGAIVQVQS